MSHGNILENDIFLTVYFHFFLFFFFCFFVFCCLIKVKKRVFLGPPMCDQRICLKQHFKRPVSQQRSFRQQQKAHSNTKYQHSATNTVQITCSMREAQVCWSIVTPDVVPFSNGVVIAWSIVQPTARQAPGVETSLSVRLHLTHRRWQKQRKHGRRAFVCHVNPFDSPIHPEYSLSYTVRLFRTCLCIIPN